MITKLLKYNLTILILVLIISAEKYTEIGGVARAQTVEHSIATDVDKYGYPKGHVDKLQILQLLRENKFGDLEDVLDSYRNQFLTDFHYEKFVVRAFHTFYIQDHTFEDHFKTWIEQNPESVNARLARAMYYLRMAWASRGHSYMQDTSDEQVDGMTYYIEKSYLETLTALKKSDQLVMGYYILMQIAHIHGDEEMSSKCLQKGLEINPHQFTLRSIHMSTLTPRWGGSYEKMAAFAKESEKLADKNPRLKVLRGHIALDKGNLLRLNDRYEEAIEYLNQAVHCGDDKEYYFERGLAFSRMGQFGKAFADFNRALSLYPQNTKALRWRGIAYYNLGMKAHLNQQQAMLKAALKDLELAKALEPYELENNQWYETIQLEIIDTGDLQSLQTNKTTLSVEDAYRTIPHRRTVFQTNQTEMSTVENEYLDNFFHLVDLAIVERVEMMSWLTTNGQKGRKGINYDKVLNDLEGLDTPSSLAEIHRLVIEAIEHQRSFLEEWQKDPGKKHNFASDPKVRGANKKLIHAYQKLIGLYANESQHNKQAFFDYLCALDFI